MTRNHASISQTVFSLSLTGALVVGAGSYSEVRAQSNPTQAGETLEETLISLQFQPPGDVAPRSTTGGGTRGSIRFAPPGDAAPNSTTGGGTRGSIRFAPPGDAAPSSTTGGGTRGSVSFAPPGDAAPNSTTGGGTRGSVSFAPPGDAAPSSTTGGGTRSNVRFAPPGDASPVNTANGGTRTSVGFAPPGDASPVNTANGGTRDEEVSILVPLIPQTQVGRTVAARPTFLVYVPRTAAREVFFSLQDEHRNHLYQTTLKLSGGGGIVEVRLPADAPELEIGKNYVWFFAVVDPGDILSPDSRGVSGWVKRVEPLQNSSEMASMKPLDMAALYASSGIWYDTLALLSAAKLAQPGDATLASEWKELLEQVGLEAIATEPIAQQL